MKWLTVWFRSKSAFVLSLISGKSSEDVVRRYTVKIKTAPDEVIDDGHVTSRALCCLLAELMSEAADVCQCYSLLISVRTAPSAWSDWPPRPDTRECWATKASSPSWWANWESADTCTIFCVWWPCTTTAIRSEHRHMKDMVISVCFIVH